MRPRCGETSIVLVIELLCLAYSTNVARAVLYVSNNRSISQISPSGQQYSFGGESIGLVSHFSGIAFDSTGSLYAGSRGSAADNAIHKYSLTGGSIVESEIVGTGNAGGLAIDSFDNLYVANV